MRLKSGDPVVFARIAEETEDLAARHIPFEIVPGVTAGLAAGGSRRNPITHRDFASAVALVTGQEKCGKSGPALDYGALAGFPGTLVFYMGVASVGRWAPGHHRRRQAAPYTGGHHSSLQLSRPDDRSLFAGRSGGGAVSAVPVGASGDHRCGGGGRPAPSLDWFEQRPLFGASVLVTRPRDQAAALADPLGELGARVLLQPAIEIGDPPDWPAVDRVLDRLDTFDWLVFSSDNGVQYLIDRLLATGRDLRALGGVSLAAIGPGTASELGRRYLKTDLQASEFFAESLAESLAAVAAGKRSCWPGPAAVAKCSPRSS